MFYYFLILSTTLTLPPTLLPPHNGHSSPVYPYPPAVGLSILFGNTSFYLMGVWGILIVDEHEFFMSRRFPYHYLHVVTCLCGQALCLQCFSVVALAVTYSENIFSRKYEWNLGTVLFWLSIIAVFFIGAGFTIIIFTYVAKKRKFTEEIEQSRKLMRIMEPQILEDISSNDATKKYLNLFNKQRYLVGYGIKKVELALYYHYMTKRYKANHSRRCENICNVCLQDYKLDDLVTAHPKCGHTCHWECFSKYTLTNLECVFRFRSLCNEKYLSGMLLFMRQKYDPLDNQTFGQHDNFIRYYDV